MGLAPSYQVKYITVLVKLTKQAIRSVAILLTGRRLNNLEDIWKNSNYHGTMQLGFYAF